MKRLAQALIIIVLITIPIIGAVIMSRGHEDWNVKRDALGLAVFDPMESIMRLGLPGPLLRTGRIMYADSFEASLAPWVHYSTADNALMERDADYSYRGAYSMKLTPKDADTFDSIAYKRFPYVYTSKMGVEVSFWSALNCETFGIYLWKHERTTRTGGRVIFNGEGGTIEIYDDTPGLQEIGAPGGIDMETPTWHLLKIVVDWENGMYERIYFDKFSYDVSSYALFSDTPATQDWVEIWLAAYDSDGTQGVCYIDDVVVTVDEP